MGGLVCAVLEAISLSRTARCTRLLEGKVCDLHSTVVQYTSRGIEVVQTTVTERETAEMSRITHEALRSMKNFTRTLTEQLSGCCII